MIPFFTIIIPTYNRALFIKNAIETVLNQTFKNFELVIIDDGSTDNTKNIVTNIRDIRIIYHYQENQERSAARNKGISLAKGKFVCFLDSDDGFYNNHLETLYSLIQLNAETQGLYYTGIECKSEEGKVTKHPLNKNNLHPVMYIWENFILMNAVCVSKSILMQLNFDVKYSLWEDTHLWLRIALHYPFFEANAYTCYTQEHKTSSVSKSLSDNSLAVANKYKNAVEDVFKLYKNELLQHIGLKKKNSYIASKYSIFFYAALNNRNFKNAFELNKKIFTYNFKIHVFLLNIFKISKAII